MVHPNKVDLFLSYLFRKFKVPEDKVFIYEVGEGGDYMLTFKIKVPLGERLGIKGHFKNTVIVHKKGTTIFTINALNKLIEKESGLGGNINHTQHQIEWEKYENKCIMLKGGELIISSVSRILL